MNKKQFAILATLALAAHGVWGASRESRYWEGKTELNGKYYWSSDNYDNWSSAYTDTDYTSKYRFVNRNFRETGSRTVSFAGTVTVSWDVLFGNENTTESAYQSYPRYMAGGPIVFQSDEENSDYGIITEGAIYIGAVDGNGSLKILSGSHKAKSWRIGNDGNMTGTLEICGGTVMVSGDPFVGVGANSVGVVTIANGGVFSCGTATEHYWLKMGDNASSRGIINVNEGGILKASHLEILNGSAELNINGGTIVDLYVDNQHHNILIPNKNNLAVTISGKGGTIDTQSNNATIAKSIGGTGGLTKKGTGTLTFTAMPTFTGKITVVAGAGDVIVNGECNIKAGDHTDRIYDSGTGKTTYSSKGDDYEDSGTIVSGTKVATDWLAKVYGDEYSAGSLPTGFNEAALAAYALGQEAKTASFAMSAAPVDGGVTLSAPLTPPNYTGATIRYKLETSANNSTWSTTTLGSPTTTIDLSAVEGVKYYRLAADVTW